MPPPSVPPPPHGRRARRVRVFLLVLAVGAALPLAWVLATRGAPAVRPEEAAAARLASLRGQVTVERPGGAVTASAGLALRVGDVVATGPDSTALLHFADGTELRVQERTRFRLEGSPRALRLVLEGGSVLSRAAGRGAGGEPGLSLTILTPQGASRILEGSEVVFELSPARSGLRVLLGELTLVEQGGAQRRVVAGEALDFTLAEVGTHGGGAQPQTAAAEPLELRLSAPRGTPRVRGRGAERFVPAPREPTPVAEGTEVRVPGPARALLTARSLRAQLSGGSEGRVGAATGSPGGDAYALALEAGTAELDFTGGGPRRLSLSGRERTLEVAVEEETSAAVAQAPEGTRLEVRAGQAQLSAGGETRTVRAGEVAHLTAAGLEVRARPAPALVLPARSPLTVYARGLREVGLALGREEGPAVRVEVARDAAFSERVLAGRTEAGHVVVEPPATGELHWRTLGEDGAVLSQGQARFLPDRASREGSRPRAEIAETGQRAAVYFQGALPSLALTYAAHPGARAYRLRVYREGALATPVLERTAPGTRSEVEAGALREGRYLWHAVPLDARGVELAGGRMNRLELVYDNALRTLVLERPRPGQRVGARGVEVRGVAPLGAHLFLDGRPVALDAKGRFHLRAAPADALVFRLVSADGGEAYWVRPLTRAPRSQ